MYKFKYIFRSLWKNKLSNSINIVGIVIGLTVSCLLLLYVKNEYSANKFFPRYNNIFKVETNGSASLSINEAKVLVENVPEIEQLTVYQQTWSRQDIVSYKGKDFKLQNGIYADSSFFKVFQYTVKYGDLNSALNNPYGIVLTQKESERIFGKINPVGELITLKASEFGINNYTVNAVIEDLPSNCSFNFNAVISLEGLMKIEWYLNNANGWGTHNYSAFALFSKNTDVNESLAKVDSKFIEVAPEWAHSLLPFRGNSLEGLHFTAKESDGVFNPNKKSTVNTLGALGVLILLIAGINYFNLNMAQIDGNKQSIGIRKTIGADNLDIGLYSFASTLVLFLLAVFLTLLTIKTVLPIFNVLAQTYFTISDIFSFSNSIFLIGILIITCVLFGFFPALLTMKQNPISATTNSRFTKKSNWLKNGLVVFQFFIAIVLLIVTLMLNKQNNFLLNSDYGFNKDNIIYIPLSPESKNKLEFIEIEYEKEAIVDEVAFGTGLWGSISTNWGRNLYTKGEKTGVSFTNLWVCKDFFKLFDLEIVHGKGFNEYSTSKIEVIYNETFVKKYAIENPLETSISKSSDKYKTVGVVKDFNFGSLRDNITPFGFICHRPSSEILFIKLNTSSPIQLNQALSKFEDTWNSVSPNFPFEYFFLDKHFKDVYEKEIKMMNILTIASFLSIFIAALGLFGLAYFIVGKRISEIGIRKVNGASVMELLKLLNQEFVIWIGIAFLIACPVAYFVISKWLQNFAYKIPIDFGLFVFAGLIALLVALITVSWQTFKVARKNPVEALRYE